MIEVNFFNSWNRCLRLDFVIYFFSNLSRPVYTYIA